MGGESSLKNCASRDETASAKEGTTLNSSIQQEREKAGVKGRDEKEDERQGGHCAPMGNEIFPCLPLPRSGCGKDNSRDLRKMPSSSLSPPAPSNTATEGGAVGRFPKHTCPQPRHFLRHLPAPGSTMSPSSITLPAQLQHCASATKFFGWIF